MRKQTKFLFALVAGMVVFLAAVHPLFAATNPIAFRLGQNTFLLPFQKVGGTQLYSFRDGKGFPGLETSLYTYQKFSLTFGAAAVLGQSTAVPFLGAQFVLPSRFFDTQNNDLLFGGYVAKEQGRKGLTVGIKCSKPLW